MDIEGKIIIITQFMRRPFVLAALVALAVVPLFLPGGRADPDLFARVAVGWLVSTWGEVPTLDPFAFSPRLPQWIDHEWLAGVVFFHLTQWGGDRALLMFSAATFLLAAWLLARAQAIVAPRSAWHGLVLLIVMADSRYLWSSVARSQLFTYVALSLWLVVFAEYLVCRRTRLLALLPLTMVAWCNLHGGFVVGLGLLGVLTGSEWLSKLAGRRTDSVAPITATFLLTIVATIGNPYGFFEYWRYILHAVSMPRPSISEWHAPGIFAATSVLLHLASGVVLFACWRRRVRSLGAAALCVTALAAAYRHERLIGIALFVVGVMWPLLFGERGSAPRGGRGERLARAFAVALAIVALAGVNTLAGRSGAGWRLNYEGYPVGATRWLLDHQVRGKLLVDFNNGSFALWRLYPHMRVSLDGRYEELYPESTVALVTHALNPTSPQHASALTTLDPDVIIVSAGVREEFGAPWRVGYADREFAVLVREGDFEMLQSRQLAQERRERMWDPPLPDGGPRAMTLSGR